MNLSDKEVNEIFDKVKARLDPFVYSKSGLDY